MTHRRIIDQINESDHDPRDPDRPRGYPPIFQYLDRDGLDEHQQRQRERDGGRKRLRERRAVLWARVALLMLVLAAAWAGAWALVGVWGR